MRQSLTVWDSASEPVVEARGLAKSYGSVHALDGLDLSVRAGEVHGFLGPNGAGKSTTIRALLGQLHLDGGTATVFGRDARSQAVEIHRDLAYVPGDTTLWPRLSGGECIDLLGRLHGTQNAERRAELLDRFELDPTRKARTYSKGNRQKVVLVAAFATEAPLLLLDEPTSGLDPIMEARFQDTVREVRGEGRTILLSSHILDEVEALCDRVTIIRAGRHAFTGTLTDLQHGSASVIETVTETPLPGAERLPGVTDVQVEAMGEELRTRLTVQRTTLNETVATVARMSPASLVVRPPSLDELFLGHYADEQVPA